MQKTVHKNKRCQFCGAELIGDLEFFSVLPRRDPVEKLKWYVCSECKVKLINKARANLK